jgi:hypothetical protein
MYRRILQIILYSINQEYKIYNMAKKSNHEADIQNKNIGTSGTNAANSKANGNRSKQLEQAKKSVPKVVLPTKANKK